MFISKFKNIKINKLFSRNSTIPKILLKKSIFFHKGDVFAQILLSKYLVGYKVGEFALTRKPFSFPEKKKKTKR